MHTPDADIHIGGWWDWVIRFVVVEAVVLVIWWFWQVRGEPAFERFGLGTVLIQWGVALAVFVLVNRRVSRRAGAPIG